MGKNGMGGRQAGRQVWVFGSEGREGTTGQGHIGKVEGKNDSRRMGCTLYF